MKFKVSRFRLILCFTFVRRGYSHHWRYSSPNQTDTDSAPETIANSLAAATPNYSAAEFVATVKQRPINKRGAA